MKHIKNGVKNITIVGVVVEDLSLQVGALGDGLSGAPVLGADDFNIVIRVLGEVGEHFDVVVEVLGGGGGGGQGDAHQGREGQLHPAHFLADCKLGADAELIAGRSCARPLISHLIPAASPSF